jgi:uncharacterized protein (UPF0303 family)
MYHAMVLPSCVYPTPGFNALFNGVCEQKMYQTLHRGVIAVSGLEPLADHILVTISDIEY